MQRYTVLQDLTPFDTKNNLSMPTTVPFEDQPQSNQDLESNQCENGSTKTQVGRWNFDQQLLYLEFVRKTSAHLENKQRRRSTKVFKQMAKLVTTRSADQCRSHHQKMEKKHGTIENILEHFKKSLNKLKAKKNQETKQKSLVVPPSQNVREISEILACEVKTPVTQQPQHQVYGEVSEFFREDEPVNFQYKLEEEESCFIDFFNENELLF